MALYVAYITGGEREHKLKNSLTVSCALFKVYSMVSLALMYEMESDLGFKKLCSFKTFSNCFFVLCMAALNFLVNCLTGFLSEVPKA